MEKGISIENLEAWLSQKPYWEQYVWKLNFQKDSLSNEDLEQCYKYLSEYLGIIDSSPERQACHNFQKRDN